MHKRANGEILPPGRRAGVCLHITSLPGPYGIGEIGDQAMAFVDSMRQMELKVWQFLPVGPTGYGDSPYQSLSTFAGNEMLIDTEGLVRAGLLKRHEVHPLTDMPADFTDYGRVIPLKTKLLRIAAGRFGRASNGDMKAGLEQFLEHHDDAWLHDYALYRILKTAHDERPWTDWDTELVRRERAALGRAASMKAREIAEIKTIQFLFFDQWKRLHKHAKDAGVSLFGDMPIYIAFDSADAWTNRDILRLDKYGHPDKVAGVPPDYFAENGQLWGNPLYDWEMHEKTDYSWWIDRLRAAKELADLVRIDHFRGFEGYWAVPADADTARNGAWEPGPGDAIFDAMHGALGALPIVAEDLGVITPEVEALRDRHHLPGMVVLQFDVCDEDFELTDVPDYCVCYTGTHDNDTTLGWFRGSPNDMRSDEEIEAARRSALEVTGGSPESISLDMARAAFSTRARLAVIPMQDFLGLGSEARMNTPGTLQDNWRWRLEPDQITDELCGKIADTVRLSGRENKNGGIKSD